MGTTDTTAALGVLLFFGAILLVVLALVLSSRQGQVEMRCPSLGCGYEGPMKKVPRGSVVVGLVLCFFGLLPGIVYFLLARGYRYTCPRCGFSISSA